MEILIKKINKHYNIIYNFFWRFFQIFIKQGIIFLIFIISAKILNNFEFGIYNYTLAIIFLLIMFGDFGISTATSKYVAEYNSIDKNKLKYVLYNSGLIVLSITIIITLLVIIFGSYYLKDKYIYTLYILPLVFLSPMTSLYDGVYRGLKKFKLLFYITFYAGIFSIIFIYFLIKYYGLVGALISQNIFYLILLIGLCLCYREFNFKIDKNIIKEIGKYSATYGLAILGNYLFIRFGILILGHYNYIEEIGVYELINKIFLIILLPFTLLGQVVAPNFSEKAIKKQYKIILNKTIKYTFYFFIIGLVLGILLYYIIPIIIYHYFPNYYNSIFLEIFPFSIIIFITNVWAATIDAGILVPSGFAKIMAYLYLILGIFGIILSLILTYYYGYLGVVFSFTICSILMVTILRILLFLKLKKMITEIDIYKYY